MVCVMTLQLYFAWSLHLIDDKEMMFISIYSDPACTSIGNGCFLAEQSCERYNLGNMT